MRKRFDPAIDTDEMAVEIGARLREELDYAREAKHAALYQAMLKDETSIRVPQVWPELSSGRLLTMQWMQGSKMLSHTDDSLAIRNRLATAMFTAIWVDSLLRHLHMPTLLRVINGGWFAAIAYSTLATKQHVALDVLAGALLGIAFALPALRWQFHAGEFR